MQKCLQNLIKNVTDFSIDSDMILAPKIASKMHSKGRKKSGGRSLFALQEASKIKLCFLVVFRCLWKLFGLPLAAFYVDFGRLLASLWPSLRPFWRPLAALFMPKVPQYQRKRKKNEKTQQTRENLPRTAENPPRFCREPAEDPRNEHHTKIFHTRQQPRRNFILQQTINEKAENRKWGGGAPPLGGVFN